MSAQVETHAVPSRELPPLPPRLEAALRVPSAAWSRTSVSLALLLGLLVALALGAQAALDWRRGSERALDVGAAGSLYSVQLLNGQIYYGTLLEVKPGYVKLGDVYYVQSYTQPNGQPGNRVVSRRKNDWHGPEWQALPTDKIVMLEAVGTGSQLARLIQQDKSASPAP
ncbi:MAG: hypothetical protein ACEQSK_02755 [Sphingomonadaceae bacterium]